MTEQLQSITDELDNIISIIFTLPEDYNNVTTTVIYDKVSNKSDTYIYYNSPSHPNKDLVRVIEGEYELQNFIENIMTFIPKNYKSKLYGTQSGI